MKKIYWFEVWIYLKDALSNSVFFALYLSVRRFQTPLEGLNFVTTLATFGIIYATDPLPQNMTKIVCLRWLAFDTFDYKSQSCWITRANFFKISIFSTRFFSETKSVTHKYFSNSDRSKSLFDCSKNLKKFHQLKNFLANVLKSPEFQETLIRSTVDFGKVVRFSLNILTMNLHSTWHLCLALIIKTGSLRLVLTSA